MRVSTLKIAYPKWGEVCVFLRRRLGIKHGVCPINLPLGSQGISSSCGARRTVCSPHGEACGWAANVHSSLMASSRSGVSVEGLIPSLCRPSPTPAPLLGADSGCQVRQDVLGQCEFQAPGETRPRGTAHPLTHPSLNLKLQHRPSAAVDLKQGSFRKFQL